jgi:uncharacterized MAPEG superfamily protein
LLTPPVHGVTRPHALRPARALQIEAAVTAYVALRATYIVVFALASSEPIAYVRSTTWALSMAATGYLFTLAAAAGTAK